VADRGNPAGRPRPAFSWTGL